MPRLLLNMIVRNEADRIVRCLESVKDHISGYVIVDTGSTDLTEDLIRDCLSDIPGEIHHAPFENFEQARNAALKFARDSDIGWDYTLFVDADMELVVDDPDVFKNLTGIGYDIQQRSETLVYMNRRLISRAATGWYRGVTHEFLDVSSSGALTGVYFKDHADGSNRVKKYERDIRLLVDALDKDPTNGRYWFYLGQSYRDAGQPAKALDAYKKRVALGGWEEETWNATVNMAVCHKDLGNEAEFTHTMLTAYNMRPTRAEPLYDLAKHFRIKGENAPGAAFAEIGMAIPRTKDILFVNDFVYTSGLREEFSICGFYVPHLKEKAFHVCDDLALDHTAYPTAREGARRNLFYYLPALRDLAPSFRFKPIGLAPDAPKYTPMNPSITTHGDNIYGVLRTVNYTITPEGRYAINGPDSSTNDSNPIHTRNYLMRFSSDMTPQFAKEILMPEDWPDPKFKLVVGFEDMRLFSWKGSLWSSSTVRELSHDGYCEQVLARVIDEGHAARVIDWRVIRREPRLYEKNWMPWVIGRNLRFVYRLGTVIDAYGSNISVTQCPYETSAMSGGSQVIPFVDAFLALVHEAHVHPHTQQRYYQHRFVQMDADGAIMAISPPFVFHDRQIEFAAGMCWSDPNYITISYGVRDAAAHIGVLHMKDIRELLSWRT